jgi:hypothetical protein
MPIPPDERLKPVNVLLPIERKKEPQVPLPVIDERVEKPRRPADRVAVSVTEQRFEPGFDLPGRLYKAVPVEL